MLCKINMANMAVLYLCKKNLFCGLLRKRGLVAFPGELPVEQGLRVFYVDGPRLSPEELRERLRRYDFF